MLAKSPSNMGLEQWWLKQYGGLSSTPLKIIVALKLYGFDGLDLS